MRLGRKLVTAVVFASLAVPATSPATEGGFGVDYVREVVVSANVKHLGSGKTGTMSFRLRSNQGAEAYKVPLTESMDEIRRDTHVGISPANTGLAEFEGCLTLKVTTVLSIAKECTVWESPSMDGDPAMTELSVNAQMGPDDSYQTSVSFSAEGTGDLQDDAAASRSDFTPTTTWVGLGVHADVERYLRRSGILRGGQLFHETKGLFTIQPASATVIMRTGLAGSGVVIRGPVMCGGGNDPIPIPPEQFYAVYGSGPIQNTVLPVLLNALGTVDQRAGTNLRETYTENMPPERVSILGFLFGSGCVPSDDPTNPPLPKLP